MNLFKKRFLIIRILIASIYLVQINFYCKFSFIYFLSNVVASFNISSLFSVMKTYRYYCHLHFKTFNFIDLIKEKYILYLK